MGGFRVTIEGLDDMIRKMDKVASPAEREKADKAALKRVGEKAKRIMRDHVPKSQDNSKSGRRLKYGQESRPKDGHARDNIPVSAPTRRGDTVSASVGWTLSDTSQYFYMKFINWGTSGVPPKKSNHNRGHGGIEAVHFLEKTMEDAEPEFEKAVQEEYEKFLKKEGL